MSKQVSEFIQRLQRHKFKFEDKSFDELYAEYPKCKSALQWWCNRNKTYSFNISGHKYLKEFLIANPPTFNISNKCCKYAKKALGNKGNYYEVIKKWVGDLMPRCEGVAEKKTRKKSAKDGDVGAETKEAFERERKRKKKRN